MQKGFKFAGNDYLGLASHPEVIEALSATAAKYGISSTSSRWAQGWTEVHEELEHNIADWMGCEDACIFGAAYFGGVIYFGQMATLGYKTVFCDEMVHSNQFLGMRAAGFEVHKFRHLDVDDLRRLTSGYQGPPAIVATDGVYGISGEVAPADQLHAVARSIGAEFFVDDAHGVGAIGKMGRGVTELLGLNPGDITVLGSVSKTLGTNGGFIAGRKELVNKFRRSPEASGSAIPPPPMAGATLTSLRLMRTDPTLRQRMEANGNRMRQILNDADIKLADTRHPILGMLLKDEYEAMAMEKHFADYGIWIPYFKYASEPRHNLLRGAARAVYTDVQLDNFEAAVKSLLATKG